MTAHNRTAVKLLPLLLAAGLISPAPSLGADFNPHNVISDRTIRDAGAMDMRQIQVFLKSKGGLGNKFDVDPTDGLLKGSAQLIYDACQRHQVNPQYLLALIQKESSAVETADPGSSQLEFATGYGVCDSCSKKDPTALKNKGLAKQIEAGAGYVKWFWETGITWPSLPRPGEPRRIDGITVTPANTATAALYGYTPHLHGNKLLSSIWNRWWGGGEKPRYPEGSLVRNEDTGQIGLIRASKLRLISSPTVLASRFGSIVPLDINQYDFAALAENSGPPIRLAEPSLVQTEEDGAIWLLIHGHKRRIASPAAFVKIGFNPEEVEDISLAEIDDYPEGAPLTVDSAAPSGYLAKDPRNGGIWWVEDGYRHPLFDRALLTLAFYGLVPRAASASDIDSLVKGDPIIFPDGSLLKSPNDPTVFVVSEGKRRPIASEAAFVTLGYRWPNIHTVSPRALDLQPMGDPLDIQLSGEDATEPTETKTPPSS